MEELFNVGNNQLSNILTGGVLGLANVASEVNTLLIALPVLLLAAAAVRMLLWYVFLALNCGDTAKTLSTGASYMVYLLAGIAYRGALVSWAAGIAQRFL